MSLQEVLQGQAQSLKPPTQQTQPIATTVSPQVPLRVQRQIALETQTAQAQIPAPKSALTPVPVLPPAQQQTQQVITQLKSQEQQLTALSKVREPSLQSLFTARQAEIQKQSVQTQLSQIQSLQAKGLVAQVNPDQTITMRPPTPTEQYQQLRYDLQRKGLTETQINKELAKRSATGTILNIDIANVAKTALGSQQILYGSKQEKQEGLKSVGEAFTSGLSQYQQSYHFEGPQASEKFIKSIITSPIGLTGITTAATFGIGTALSFAPKAITYGAGAVGALSTAKELGTSYKLGGLPSLTRTALMTAPSFLSGYAGYRLASRLATPTTIISKGTLTTEFIGKGAPKRTISTITETSRLQPKGQLSIIETSKGLRTTFEPITKVSVSQPSKLSITSPISSSDISIVYARTRTPFQPLRGGGGFTPGRNIPSQIETIPRTPEQAISYQSQRLTQRYGLEHRPIEGYKEYLPAIYEQKSVLQPTIEVGRTRTPTIDQRNLPQSFLRGVKTETKVYDLGLKGKAFKSPVEMQPYKTPQPVQSRLTIKQLGQMIGRSKVTVRGERTITPSTTPKRFAKPQEFMEVIKPSPLQRRTPFSFEKPSPTIETPSKSTTVTVLERARLTKPSTQELYEYQPEITTAPRPLSKGELRILQEPYQPYTVLRTPTQTRLSLFSFITGRTQIQPQRQVPLTVQPQISIQTPGFATKTTPVSVTSQIDLTKTTPISITEQEQQQLQLQQQKQIQLETPFEEQQYEQRRVPPGFPTRSFRPTPPLVPIILTPPTEPQKTKQEFTQKRPRSHRKSEYIRYFKVPELVSKKSYRPKTVTL